MSPNRGGGKREVNTANHQTKESLLRHVVVAHYYSSIAAWLNMHMTDTHIKISSNMMKRKKAFRGTGTSEKFGLLNNVQTIHFIRFHVLLLYGLVDTTLQGAFTLHEKI